MLCCPAPAAAWGGYATNKTYKVQFRFAVCGKEALSSVLTVKVMK